MSFYDYLKNIFLFLILLQVAPPLIQSIRKQYGLILEPKTKVGVVPFQEMISDADCYIKVLKNFFEDNDIKAILFKMDCQGSTAGSGQMIYEEILALKKKYPKPVITLVENICASGGYWIACASDHIIAPGTAMIGSIGTTFMYTFNLHEFLAQYKINYKDLKAGEFKGATNPFAPTTESEYAMLQGLLDDTYQQFIQAVAAARKLPVNTAKEWANGKLFTGLQASKLGLIDELGSTSTVTRVIEEKALIEGEIEFVKPTSEQSFFARALGLKPCTSIIQEIATALSKHMVTAQPHIG